MKFIVFFTFLTVQTVVGYSGPESGDALKFNDLEQIRNLTNKSISGIVALGSPISGLLVEYGYGNESVSIAHGNATTDQRGLLCFTNGSIITTIDVYADATNLYGIQFHLLNGSSCGLFGNMSGTKQTPLEASDLKYISGNATTISIHTLEFHFTKETGTTLKV